MMVVSPELEKIMPKYLASREKGMTAWDVSKKMGMPLKEVISFLMERDILNNEQIDLELVRIMLANNQELKNRLITRYSLSIPKIDYALVTQNNKIFEEIWDQFNTAKISLNFPIVILPLVSLFKSRGMPYVLIIIPLLFIFFSEYFFPEEAKPESNIDKILKIFKEA